MGLTHPVMSFLFRALPVLLICCSITVAHRSVNCRNPGSGFVQDDAVHPVGQHIGHYTEAHSVRDLTSSPDISLPFWRNWGEHPGQLLCEALDRSWRQTARRPEVFWTRDLQPV